MCLCLFLLKLKPVSNSSVFSFFFILLPFYFLKAYCFSTTFHDLRLNSTSTNNLKEMQFYVLYV